MNVVDIEGFHRQKVQPLVLSDFQMTIIVAAINDFIGGIPENPYPEERKTYEGAALGILHSILTNADGQLAEMFLEMFPAGGEDVDGAPEAF